MYICREKDMVYGLGYISMKRDGNSLERMCIPMMFGFPRWDDHHISMGDLQDPNAGTLVPYKLYFVGRFPYLYIGLIYGRYLQ
jgi:hypothetical protein